MKIETSRLVGKPSKIALKQWAFKNIFTMLSSLRGYNNGYDI